MKWTILIIALIIVVAFSCTSTRQIDKPRSTSQKLEGSWTMYKEVCCGRRNMERTGEQMKMPKQLIFTSNNKITIMDLKTTESKTTTYKVETTQEGDNPAIEYINYEGKKGVLQFENDELIIDYGYMDLQKEFYRKDN